MAFKRHALPELIASTVMPECVQHEVLLSFPKYQSALAANPWLCYDVFAKLYVPGVSARDAAAMADNITDARCIDVMLDAGETRISVLRPLLWRWELSTSQLSRLASTVGLDTAAELLLEDSALAIDDRARLSAVSDTERLIWLRAAALDAEAVAVQLPPLKGHREDFAALFDARPDVARIIACDNTEPENVQLLEALALAPLTQSEMLMLARRAAHATGDFCSVLGLLVSRVTPSGATRHAIWEFADTAGLTDDLTLKSKLPRAASWLDHDGALTTEHVDFVLTQTSAPTFADMTLFDVSSFTREQLIRASNTLDTYSTPRSMRRFREAVTARVLAGDAGDALAERAEKHRQRYGSHTSELSNDTSREQPSLRSDARSTKRPVTAAKALDRLTEGGGYLGKRPVARPAWSASDSFGGYVTEVGAVLSEALGDDRSAWSLLFTVVEKFEGSNIELIELAKSMSPAVAA